MLIYNFVTQVVSSISELFFSCLLPSFIISLLTMFCQNCLSTYCCLRVHPLISVINHWVHLLLHQIRLHSSVSWNQPRLSQGTSEIISWVAVYTKENRLREKFVGILWMSCILHCCWLWLVAKDDQLIAPASWITFGLSRIVVVRIAGKTDYCHSLWLEIESTPSALLFLGLVLSRTWEFLALQSMVSDLSGFV